MVSPEAAAYRNHYAIFGAFLRSGFAHVDNVITKEWSKQSHGCSCQGCKATNHTGALRNLPELASRTDTSTRRNSSELSGNFRNGLQNRHQHAPELSGNFRNCLQNLHQHAHRNLPELTFRNLLEPESGTYTRPSEPSGASLPKYATRNSPEPSGTFLRNLLLRPGPAHTRVYLGRRPI